jgi:hypothetical protein
MRFLDEFLRHARAGKMRSPSGDIPSFNPRASHLTDTMSELVKYDRQEMMDRRHTEVCVINLSLGSWATMSMMSVRVMVRRIPSDRRP